MDVLVVIPAYGRPELTNRVLGDLLQQPVPAGVDVVVVDNAGDYELPIWSAPATVHRPDRNLRWIGSANWALSTAQDEGFDVCVILNNDLELSPMFLSGLVTPFREAADIAVVAPVYNDVWPHQRAERIPDAAHYYLPQLISRTVPFVDGAAVALSMKAVTAVGPFDAAAFPKYGYGADLDYGIRVRAAGYRSVVTEMAYASHLGRATIGLSGAASRQIRDEIWTGMAGKWGDRWRSLLGLSEMAFPGFDQRVTDSWYLQRGSVPV